MTSAIEETFFDFDINYLHSTSDNTEIQCKLEKYRKSILNLKKKTISTNCLIKKYYAKREQLEQTEKNLFESKEECKKVCIDYRNTLETCARLENDIQLLQNANKELEEKCFIAENQCTALKSHANQLQQLILEHQSEIETLKLEKKPNKTIVKTESKRYSEKLFNAVKKENDTLRKHISLFRDIALGKRKLNSQHKVLLQKYEDFEGCCSDSGDKADEQDDYVFSPPPSPICMEDDSSATNFDEVSDTLSIQRSPDIKISKGSDSLGTPKRTENDGSSIDTGRGSSLACSDSEKFIGSPNYSSNDSPLSALSPNSRPEKQYAHVATSPIFILENVDVSNSPISLSKGAQSEQNNYAEITTDTTVVNTLSDCLTTERSITPVKSNKDLKRNIFSPLKGHASDVAALVNNKNKMTRTVFKILPNKERMCLERNNSNNFCNENSNDGEIEEILQKMRLSYPMTPMPQTPDLNRASRCISIAENSQTEHRIDLIHPEVAALKEEIKVLRDCIAENNKGMIDIKNLLQMEILSQQKSVHVPTQLNIEREDVDTIVYNNEYDINNSERPSSVQTVIIEPEEQTVVRSPSPCMQESDTCDNDTLFIHEPDTIIQTDECLLTEVNKTPNVSIEFEDSVPFPVEINTIPVTSIDAPNDNNKVLSNQDIASKKFHRRKLSKLNKLKAKMVPRYKIISGNKPIQKRKCLKPKPIIMKKKRKVLDSDNSASLNDKSIYEKAVKVMSEIKANHGTDSSRLTPKVVLIKCNVSNTNNVMELLNNIKPVPKLSLPKNNTLLCKKTTVEKKVTDQTAKLFPHSEHVSNINDTDNKFKTRSRRNSNKDKTEKQSIEINKLSKISENSDSDSNKTLANSRRITRSNTINIIQASSKETEENKETHMNSQIIRKNLKRPSQDVDKLESPNKRMLRSSTIITKNKDSHHLFVEANGAKRTDTYTTADRQTIMDVVQKSNTVNTEVLSYNDLDMFSNDNNTVPENSVTVHSKCENREKEVNKNPGDNALCSMLQKYGVTKVSHKARKISDKTIKAIGEKLEQNIGKIIEMSDKEAKTAMDKLVSEIENLDMKVFIYGVMNYLQDPQRKLELFKKVVMPPAPPMSKSEQVLLYIISQLNNYWASDDFLEKILGSIEYVMFAINRTPEFNVIESMSHFYAILCRYYQRKCRLRLFMLDAMYCLQFKSIALIKQCIEVWMHVLPLAHMGIAKSPLVTCVVYLLHFYKCEDKFNRVTEIRNILSRKYFFNITNWNENSILDMFRTAIMEMKGNTLQKKMLRTALLLLAKRQGPQWCQKHIINNLLKPIIEKNSVKENIRVYCISMIGPLMKPYPLEMKVHYEIIMNELVEMLRRPASTTVQEAIITSMLCLSRQNQNNVIHALLCWEPTEISPKLEKLLRKFIRSKPVKVWKSLLSKLFLSST